MNTTIELLYHLDINLDYYDKLKKYYYIPENKISNLKLGGFVFLVDKYISSKKLYYKGYLIQNSSMLVFNSKDYFSISLEEAEKTYHFFYKPRKNKMLNAIELLNNIN